MDIRNLSPKIMRTIEMHFQAHKRYGKSTIETERRFKDLRSDIIKLLNDVKSAEGVKKSGITILSAEPVDEKMIDKMLEEKE